MWIVVLAIVAAVLAGSGTVHGGNAPAGAWPKGRGQVVQAGAALGLPPTWIDWLVWVSKGESNWNTAAHNETSGEVAASSKAYDRLVSEARWHCAGPKADYAIGSGGWYGQLAPYTAMWGLEMGLGCGVLELWRDPIASTRIHLRQVKGTLKILRQKTGGKGTFLQLRALYGLPSRDPAEVDTPERRAQYSNTLKKAGIDPSFLDQIVPDLPGGVV